MNLWVISQIIRRSVDPIILMSHHDHSSPSFAEENVIIVTVTFHMFSYSDDTAIQ